MNKKIVIRATITTVSPVSISMPVAEGGRENAFGNFPVMTRGVDEGGNKLQTGYLPATTLRGFLRRAVTLRSMRAAAKAGKPYRLSQVYSEMIGQDAESEKQAGDIDLLALREAREESPVLDLFGSGLGIKSRLKVSHFLPTTNVLPEAITGVRKDLDDTEAALDLMDPSDMNRFLSRSGSNTKRAAAAALVKQIETQVRRMEKKGEAVPADTAKALTVARAELEKFKDEMGDMKNSTRTILTHYVLPAGLVLSGKIIVDNARDRDMELLDHALNELSLQPVLGAQSARGCGEIAGTLQFFDGDGKLLKNVAIGDFKPARVTEIAGAE